MLKFAKVLVCSLLMCLWAVSASADVTYNFYTIPPIPPNPESTYGIYGTFTLTVPTFISSPETFDLSSSLTGTFHSSEFPTYGFLRASFVPTYSNSLISFMGGFENAGQGQNYDFSPGIFGTVGSYVDLNGESRLDVSGTGTVTAAPEPATMLLLGLGLVGLAGVRKKFKN